MEHALRKLEDENSKIKFYCARCSNCYEKKGTFIRHHLEAHLNLTSNQWTCSICNAEGLYKNFNRLHFRSHHKTDGLDPSKIPRCDQCPAYFIRGSQLIIHKIKMHGNGNICPECESSFKTRCNLKYHMERKHPHLLVSLLPFVCDASNCSVRFGTEAELKKHAKTHEKDDHNVLKCLECDKTFHGKYKLQIHVQNVHSGSSHVCPECGKAFKMSAGLYTHLEFHKGPDSWQFQCSTCGRKFAFKHKLEEHVRTHTKEKPFVCQYCGGKYAHRHNWRNHVKTKHKDEDDQQVETEIVRKGNYLSRKGSKKGEYLTASGV